MRLGKKVKNRLIEQYAELRAGASPPTLAVCLYDKLMLDISGVYGLRTLDVKALMLVEQFEGMNKNQIVKLGALHHKSYFVVFRRMEALGHIYSPSEVTEGKGIARPIYLTDSGRQITFEAMRLWSEVCRSAIKRKSDLDKVEKTKVKPKKAKKRVKQFKPFTLGA